MLDSKIYTIDDIMYLEVDNGNKKPEIHTIKQYQIIQVNINDSISNIRQIEINIIGQHAEITNKEPPILKAIKERLKTVITMMRL